MNTLCTCGHPQEKHNVHHWNKTSYYSVCGVLECTCMAFAPAEEKKEVCGVIIHVGLQGNDTCANKVPCFMHDPEENKKWKDSLGGGSLESIAESVKEQIEENRKWIESKEKVSEKHEWREDVREKVLPFGLWHDHPSGYEQRIIHIINFITEVETEAYTKGFDMALMGQEMAKREARRTTIEDCLEAIDNIKLGGLSADMQFMEKEIKKAIEALENLSPKE